ncbi:MAG: amidohydrolase [Chthoniobacterales bacterium]|nr:amidohydrolase [Chthoniobacterales bacterium]
MCGMLHAMNARFWLPILLASTTLLSAQQAPQSIADAELPSLLIIYKDLHTHPELSTREERSAGIVAKELKAAGCEVTERVGKYEKPGSTCFGVIGVMKNGAGPTVAIRSDLDGLPVREETGLPYASSVSVKNDAGQDVGVMHACGHDIHMSALIGTARALGKLKDKWQGTIIFIGQPAEETVGGARALLKDGLYTRWPKPDYVLGLHDDAEIAAGQIGVTEGYCYANVDSVDVTVKGMGGHGAYPHKTKDPVVLAAEIINGWQTIASRETNPHDDVVVTVGSIQGGTKHNIISDEVKMQLTVRTYKKEVRDVVLAAIARIAKGCAIAAGLPEDRMPDVHVRQDEFTPATYNNPELTRRVSASLKSAIGDANVILKDPTMGGEDFSEYSLPDHSIPAFMFNVGAVDPAKAAESKRTGSPLPSLHSSKFAPLPEPTIRTGVVGMTTAVLDLLKK